MQFARSRVAAGMDIDRVPTLTTVPWYRALAAERMIDLYRHILNDTPAEKNREAFCDP